MSKENLDLMYEELLKKGVLLLDYDFYKIDTKGYQIDVIITSSKYWNFYRTFSEDTSPIDSLIENGSELIILGK